MGCSQTTKNEEITRRSASISESAGRARSSDVLIRRSRQAEPVPTSLIGSAELIIECIVFPRVASAKASLPTECLSFVSPSASRVESSFFSRPSPGDIKLYGEGASRLAGEIRQAMLGSDPVEFDEAFDQDLLPTEHEASILSGGSSTDDEMPASLLEMDADQEDDDEEEEEEDEEAEDADEYRGSSFFEEQPEAAAETDGGDVLFSSEGSDGNAEEEEAPASFLESEDADDLEGDNSSFDPWGNDEEDEEEEAAEDNEETGDRLMAAADPYGDNGVVPKSSFYESEAEAEEHMFDDEQDEEQPSFLEEQETGDEEEEEGPFSFIQLEARKTVGSPSRRPRSSSMQVPLAPPNLTDQTDAENEMLAEAGESPMNLGQEESGDAMGGEAEESEEPAAGRRGLEEAEAEGGAPSAAEAQADEIYGGPADPLIRYGGRSDEDLEAEGGVGGAPGEEDLAEEGLPSSPLDEETAGGEDSLQQRAEETADERGNAVPPTTEEELAADLQGAFPRLHASKPHVVQRRHVDQDIRMTEALRTEAKAGTSGASALGGTMSLLTVVATTGVLTLLFH
ncbi:hypothetical protein Esti_005356 [Eimeria stiedai]